MTQSKRSRMQSEFRLASGAPSVEAPVNRFDQAQSQDGHGSGFVSLEAFLWDMFDVEKVACGLGVFSFVLGLSELFAPRLIARMCGGQAKNAWLVRLFGLREIASGVLILSQGKRPANGVWTRVLGDGLDLAALGSVFLSKKSNRLATILATANVAAVTAIDFVTALELSRQKGTLTQNGAVSARRNLFVNKPAAELYDFWHNFENLPKFMRNVSSITKTGENQYRWVIKGPAGVSFEWDAKVTEDIPGELITWESVCSTPVNNMLEVRFLPVRGKQGTIVELEIEYGPPGGLIGAQVAKLLRADPSIQAKDELRRFKQIIETGEIIRSDASPDGYGTLLQRPARPSPDGNQSYC